MGIVNASSTHADRSLSYQITAGNDAGLFAIHSTTGQISVADGSQLSYATTQHYLLTIEASDAEVTDTILAVIHINATPTIAAGQQFNSLEHPETETFLGQVIATDVSQRSLHYPPDSLTY